MPSGLLDPIIRAQTTKTGASFARLMEATLLAQINSGQVEPAIAIDEGPRSSPDRPPAAPSFTSSWANCWKENLTACATTKNTPSLKRMQAGLPLVPHGAYGEPGRPEL